MPSLVTVPLHSAARLIVIGDIHGCFVELRALLDRIRPRDLDVVVSAGDIVRKGPDAVRCLELWRERGYLAVSGNNEDKLLATPWWRRFFLRGADHAVLRRRDLVSYIRSWPAVIDVPDATATIVHGGLFPRMTVTADEVTKHRDDLVRLRWMRRNDGSWQRVPKGQQREGDVLWPDVWDGERTVLYGHTPLREPRIDRHSIGLDTGCGYGGSLTAAVWDRGTWTVMSEPARRAYSNRQ